MSFDLCQIKRAQKPYFIESIRTNIFSAEELCFYLRENLYLIDRSIVNEVLCDWIRDELGLKKLYRQLYDQLEKSGSITQFIMLIFREVGYLDPEQMRLGQEELGKLEVQPEDTRAKLKADYLVKCGMYSSAVHEYQKVLERMTPGSLGTQFYASVWNNLGCARARMFLFRDAADCFLRAWKLVRTKETMRRYVSVLPLFLSEEEYGEKLRDLGADAYLITRIQKYNAHLGEEYMEKYGGRGAPEDIPAVLAELKEEYRRGAKC